jgi:hypothetical protein
MEVEILKEALDKARPKKPMWLAAEGRFRVSVMAKVLGISGSQLHARLAGPAEPRRHYHKADDAVLLPLIMALVTTRPTYGYRRITTLLNRRLRTAGATPVNHRRVYRIMQAHCLLLAGRYTARPDHARDGKVVTLRPNLRSPSGSERCRPRWLAARTASSSRGSER